MRDQYACAWDNYIIDVGFGYMSCISTILLRINVFLLNVSKYLEFVCISFSLNFISC